VSKRTDVAVAILFLAERPSPQGEVSGGYRRDSPLPRCPPTPLAARSDVSRTKEKRWRQTWLTVHEEMSVSPDVITRAAVK